MCFRMSLFDILVRTIRLVLTFSYICGEVKGIVCYFKMTLGFLTVEPLPPAC